jgi:hypothetical protein
MAFGAALALVNDFHRAEDVVQEAFVAAWSALPSLADPAAFPGWLHGIVRHQEFRCCAKGYRGPRRSQKQRVSHTRRCWPTAAWSSARNRRWRWRRSLPGKLREEPATLLFIHDCSRLEASGCRTRFDDRKEGRPLGVRARPHLPATASTPPEPFGWWRSRQAVSH